MQKQIEHLSAMQNSDKEFKVSLREQTLISLEK
jgi:hypothetical protein